MGQVCICNDLKGCCHNSEKGHCCQSSLGSWHQNLHLTKVSTYYTVRIIVYFNNNKKNTLDLFRCGCNSEYRGVCIWEGAIVLGLTVVQSWLQQCACSSDVAVTRRCPFREVPLYRVLQSGCHESHLTRDSTQNFEPTNGGSSTSAKRLCSLFTRHVPVQTTPYHPSFEISRVSSGISFCNTIQAS